MNKRGMTCCCDISSGLNCTEFLKYCFNTQDPLNFPLTALVSGTGSGEITLWGCCPSKANSLVMFNRQSGAFSYSGTLTRAYPPSPNDCNGGQDTWNNGGFGGSRVVYCGDVTWSCTGNGSASGYCCDPSQPDCGPDQPQYECDCQVLCNTYQLQGGGTQRVMLQCGSTCGYRCTAQCTCNGFDQGCCNLHGWILNSFDHPNNSGSFTRTDTYVGQCCTGQAPLPCVQIISGDQLASIAAFSRGCAGAPCYGDPYCNTLDNWRDAYSWPSGGCGLGAHRTDITTPCGPLTVNENNGTFTVSFQ